MAKALLLLIMWTGYEVLPEMLRPAPTFQI